MDNYAERSSLGTIMGPLYMIPCVWHEKDGAMESFLWKLWASLTDMADNFAGRIGPLEGSILAIFGSKGAN